MLSPFSTILGLANRVREIWLRANSCYLIWVRMHNTCLVGYIPLWVFIKESFFSKKQRMCMCVMSLAPLCLPFSQSFLNPEKSFSASSVTLASSFLSCLCDLILFHSSSVRRLGFCFKDFILLFFRDLLI